MFLDSAIGALFIDYDHTWVPQVFQEIRWSPVMVLSHPCEMEKELSPRVRALEEQIASLTPLAIGVLRYKLSECLTARDLSIVAELQAMVGQVIEDVVILPKSQKASSLQLYLRNGDVAHLEIRKPRNSYIQEVRRLGARFWKP